MAKPKLTKLDDFIQGDTPLFVFDATVNNVAFDVTDWTGYFTLTPTTGSPVVSSAVMTKDETDNTFSYQLTNTISKNLTPGTTYTYNVKVQKDPVESNTFTLSRGTVGIAEDYGV